MQFREALALVCAEPVAPGGEFFTHAKLCDLCANDFKSKAKVELFYRIDRELSVVYRIQNEGKDAARALLESYPKVKDIIGQKKFDDIIDIYSSVKVYRIILFIIDISEGFSFFSELIFVC